MFVGMELPALVGQISEQEHIYIQKADPLSRKVTWTPWHSATEAAFIVYLDDRRSYTTDTTITWLLSEEPARPVVIFEVLPSSIDEDLSKYIPDQDHIVTITWTASTDCFYYLIARAASTGAQDWDAPLASQAGGGERSYTDIPGEGVWYYKIRSYDAAGNYTDSNEITVTLDSAPAQPTNVAVTLNETTHDVTLTWTDSTSADIDHYAIYATTGLTGVDVVGGLLDTVATGVETWTFNIGTPVTDLYTGMVKAVDAAGNISASWSAMQWLAVLNDVAVSYPSTPYNMTLKVAAAGAVKVSGWYDRTNETGSATHIRVFKNDGAGGAINWSVVVGSVALSSVTRSKWNVTTDALGAVAATYKVGVMAYGSDGGLYDMMYTEVGEILIDPTAPGAFTASYTTD